MGVEGYGVVIWISYVDGVGVWGDRKDGKDGGDE